MRKGRQTIDESRSVGQETAVAIGLQSLLGSAGVIAPQQRVTTLDLGE
jgi:hypothetical protein